ncbi:MAG: hypothetical protein GY744_09485 [Gammaproteobacteria bacterium]|nr:hypothetical protein [Gammaproteobacteria bacterium]
MYFVLVPQEKEGLCQLFREVHRDYTRHINFRELWKGHLWQERFHSFVVELNPVKAKLCCQSQDWVCASAHLLGRDDHVVMVNPMLELIADWRTCLPVEGSEEDLSTIRRFSSSGRPAGNASFD